MEKTNSGNVSSACGVLGWLVLLAIAALIFFLDQLTKALVVRNLAPMGYGYHVPLIGDWLRLSYATNSGAAFGILPDRTIILTIVALAAVPLLVFAQNHLPVSGWTAKVCVGLLLGGTLGNLTDRLRFGHVVDFVDAGAGNLRWPTFNVADSAFVVGVIAMLVIGLFFTNVNAANPRSPRDAA